MTKATSAAKSSTTKKTTKKTTTKSTTKKTAARSTSKARTAAKKTTATRTATKKAATTKSASSAKPATKAKKAGPKTKTATKAAPKAATKKATAKSTKKAAPKKATASTAPKTKAKTKSEKEKLKTATKSAAAASVPAKTTKKESTAKKEAEAPKIAPAPMRPALRVAKRAEARRDKNQTFQVKTKIIYPAHGVGHITDIEKQSIADIDVELFVIDFDHEKMKLRVPVVKAAAAGMRNLSTPEQIDDAMRLIEGKARVKRTMWSRRAQEYEAKINSGDLISVAEVVRDLFRADDQPEQSYSERQLFEQARERFGREVAAVRDYKLEDAIKEIHVHLDRKEKPAA